jgi:hypothetical protein
MLDIIEALNKTNLVLGTSYPVSVITNYLLFEILARICGSIEEDKEIEIVIDTKDLHELLGTDEYNFNNLLILCSEVTKQLVVFTLGGKIHMSVWVSNYYSNSNNTEITFVIPEIILEFIKANRLGGY